MRWLVLTNSPWPRGGLQSRTRELARGLIELGDHVNFVCFQANPYVALDADFAKGCRFHSPPVLNTRSLRPKHVWAAIKILRSIRPDVLFFCNTGTPDFLPFVAAARILKRGVVVHHGNDPELPKEGERRRYLGGAVSGIGLWRRELVFSCRLSYRWVSRALFNNVAQMESWLDTMNVSANKCQLWFPPLDLSNFRADATVRRRLRAKYGLSEAFVVGGIGALNQHKSFDVAIRAVHCLRDKIPNAHLVLIGDGPERRQLEELSQQLQLENRVTFLGERADVHQVMNAFDVLCVSSTSETLGIAILEAMATQVPVIVPDLPGPARLADNGKCAMVFPAGDFRALAEVMCRLWRDKALATSLVRNGSGVAAKCHYREVARELREDLLWRH